MSKQKLKILIALALTTIVATISVILIQGPFKKQTLTEEIDATIQSIQNSEELQKALIDRNPETLKKCLTENDRDACQQEWTPVVILRKHKEPTEIAGFYKKNANRCNDIPFSARTGFSGWKKALKKHAKSCPLVVFTYWKFKPSSECNVESPAPCLPVLLTYAIQEFQNDVPGQTEPH